MDQQILKARARLLALAETIRTRNYPHDSREWGGADVVITSRQPKPTKGGFYPEPRHVVTPFSREVSWLFEQMRDAFAPFLDSCPKIEFYGRLANMANRYLRRLKGSDEVEKDLLLAVLHEAFSILEEMEDGQFEFLPIAVGNTIADDLIERAEGEGYLGPEETERFFDDMERRYHDA